MKKKYLLISSLLVFSSVGHCGGGLSRFMVPVEDEPLYFEDSQFDIKKIINNNFSPVDYLNFQQFAEQPFRMTVATEELIESFNNADFDQMKAALNNQADVNVIIFGCYTLLYWAARSGDLQMVKFLLHHGARFEIGQLSPLDAAIEQGNIEMVNVMMAFHQFFQSGIDVMQIYENL